MSARTHFAVYLYRNGAHESYVETTTHAEPYKPRTLIGYTGHKTMREALADAKRWRQSHAACTCRDYLRRKGIPMAVLDF